MKILDWFYYIYYCSTMKNGSRDERAVFLFWLASSFIYVALIYLMLILVKVQSVKALFFPIWIFIFALNYLGLRRIYIKNGRSKYVLGNREEVSRFRVVVSTIYTILSIFFAATITVLCAFYYGKYINLF